MASRVFGFARDMFIAAMLGAGPVADAFFVALKLPNLFRRLFGEGAFNAAFVPTFAGTLAAEGPAAARRIAEQALAMMTVFLGALTLLGILVMPYIMTVLAPGFSADPAKFTLAVEMTRITFPYLLLICLVALLSGVLNGLNKFAMAAGAPLLFNVVSMATLWLLTPYVATPGHALSWGVTLSGVLQLILVAHACAAAGMPLRMPRPRLTPEMRVLLRRMAPGIVGAGVTQLNLAVDVIIASLLPGGSVSYLYYADRVNQLPLGVIGAAVGTALLPLLSRQVRAGEEDASRATLNQAVEISLVLTLPAALALAAISGPVVSTLFGRGAFGGEAVAATSAALAVFAIGLPAYVLTKAFAPGFFARGDTSTPVKIGVAAVALNLVLNLSLMYPLAHVGVALATALAALFNAGLLGFILWRRGHFAPSARLRTRTLRMVLAAVAMAAILWFGQQPLAALLSNLPFARLIGLAVLVGVGGAAYLLVGQSIGAFDIREILKLVRRRRASRA